MPQTPSVEAERTVNVRIFTATIVAFGLLANYGTTYALKPAGWIDITHLLMGPFLGGVLLLILSIGRESMWSNHPTVRALIGDESTTEHRRRAQGFGFWTMVTVGAIVCVADPWLGLPGGKAVQGVLTLAVSAAALRFGYLEQRALAHG